MLPTTWSLRGSSVAHRRGASPGEPADPDRRLQVTVVLHPRGLKRDRVVAAPSVVEPVHPASRRPLGSAALQALYHPGSEAIRRVRAFAQVHGLDVVEVSPARHDVVLEGTTAALNAAFGVEMRNYHHDLGAYRAHGGGVAVPEDLGEIVDGVIGLDDVPLHRPNVTPGSSGSGLSAAKLAAHYRFPEVDARGLRVALVEFSGGFHRSDVIAYAKRMGVPLPRVNEVRIAGADGAAGANKPMPLTRLRALAGDWTRAKSFADLARVHGPAALDWFMSTMEVTMDVELAVSLGAGAVIDVYFAPPGADGWRRVISAAIGEGYGRGRRRGRAGLPAVLSISWGDSESSFGPMKLRLIHGALESALLKGVAVCCSSGDRGSCNSFEGCAGVNVNFPASSPAVLSCGGTALVPSSGSAAVREVAWNGELLGMRVASGGGMSGWFSRPAFQQGLKVTPVEGTWLAPEHHRGFAGRWLPDVAANAAFESGVGLVVGGLDLVGGGTSAATPLCAALLGRVRAAVGHPLAGLNAWLYGLLPDPPVRDIVDGDNDVCDGRLGYFRAGRGWDACTGLGAPDGLSLVDALCRKASYHAR